MEAYIIDFETISDEEFDEWFCAMSKLYAESIIQEIESDLNFKNAPGLSSEAYENLMKRVEELKKTVQSLPAGGGLTVLFFCLMGNSRPQ